MSNEPEPIRDTHYEVELDPEPAQNRAPVYVDVVAKQDNRRPILPAGWHRGNIKSSLTYYGGRTAYRVGYHALRSPWYTMLALFWSTYGVFRLAGRQLRWAWHPELNQLLQEAASKGDLVQGPKVEKQLASRRSNRAILLGAEFVLLLVAAGMLSTAPRWMVLATAAALVPVLAHYGRPQTMPIVRPAVVVPRFRKLNSDIVLRAYYAAKLGDSDKHPIGFASTMARDGEGSGVLIDLDFGFTTDDAIKAKGQIASGLDVSVNQVYLTRDKSSIRRHRLWVADQDPLAIPAGRTPLLACRPADIWQPAPFGIDERGRPVTISLLWISILVGAQPRKGKTFSARLLALYAALDPYVVLIIADGKNSPDWKGFRRIAHRFITGTAPNPHDSDPVGHLLVTLMEIKKHIEDVNSFLSTLPVSECPDGKITRELSRKYKQLRVWMLVMEEFQNYYELDDQNTNKEIAGLLSFIMAVGPSAGVILLSSSQKPSGVGAGDVTRLFNRFRDNHAVRFALKCGSRDVSIAVLGGDAYQEGYDASALPIGPEYRGVGILYGYSDETPVVRTHLADGADAERICAAARRFREQTGTLTGEAAGEDMTRQSRDVLADVIKVWAFIGRAGVHWVRLAELLAEHMPEQYAGETADSISALVRAEGVDSVNVNTGGSVLKGCQRKTIEAALRRREITEK